MRTSLDHEKLEVYQAALELSRGRCLFWNDCLPMHPFAINWIGRRPRFP